MSSAPGWGGPSPLGLGFPSVDDHFGLEGSGAAPAQGIGKSHKQGMGPFVSIR